MAHLKKIAACVALCGATHAHGAGVCRPAMISGVCPQLGLFNDDKGQSETGVGAVVPYAGELWVITYSGHKPYGSGDGLYALSPDLSMVRRPESIGGTPANRAIDRHSGDLLIGPYVIDQHRHVRALSLQAMPGRYTATTPDPFQPGKMLTYTMEEGLYRVDPKTLAHQTLFADGNTVGKNGQLPENYMLPGYHGKGAWASQGVLVVANNGEVDYADDKPSGSLSEWGGTPGKNDRDASPWRVVMRDQFTEVTGPGGIGGPVTPEEPIWSLGWDKRSLLLALRDHGEWSFRRLPEGSFTYGAKHGWYTEWPRIRDVEGDPLNGKGRHLMTMHGQLFDFDPSYRAGHTVAPRPLTAYLHIVGDFARWQHAGNDDIVFGTDDVTVFANPLARRSESNLWFVKANAVDQLGGPALGWGAVWLDDAVIAGTPSDAMSVAGYAHRSLSLSTKNDEPVFFTVQQDLHGDGHWTIWKVIQVPANGFVQTDLAGVRGDWVRVTSSADAPGVSAVFQLARRDTRTAQADPAIFGQLAPLGQPAQPGYGFIQGVPDRGFNLMLNGRTTTLDVSAKGFTTSPGMAADAFAKEAVPEKVEAIHVTGGAVLVEGKGTTWRLPKFDALDDAALPGGWARTRREVVTERSLLHAAGTFFELPRDDAGGITGIRPVATHDFAISDFADWRGLLLMTGVRKQATADGRHIFDVGDLGQLWMGTVDDLWKLGKPRGTVEAFEDADVAANRASDPCLMYGYDRKTLIATQAGSKPVRLALEVGVEGDGRHFHRVREIIVAPHQHLELPLQGLMARWARLVPLDDAHGLTAGFRYE
jgi:hypothetical protein